MAAIIAQRCPGASSGTNLSVWRSCVEPPAARYPFPNTPDRPGASGPCPRREGRSYTCLSNGKLERNIGECAGSGGLSHSPAERLGELEFDCQAESSKDSAQACRSVA